MSGEEKWKNISFAPGYQASNMGNVRAKKRVIANKGRLQVRQPLECAQHMDKGYLFVILYRKGKRIRKYVHQLVADAFLGPNPDESTYTVDHIDRNKLNNSPENLRYATRSEQAENRVTYNADSLVDGRILSEEEKEEIRGSGKGESELANVFGVSVDMIRKIRE
jgi:hypothetical protein